MLDYVSDGFMKLYFLKKVLTSLFSTGEGMKFGAHNPREKDSGGLADHNLSC